MPLLAKLRGENKVRIETLEASGRWFKNKYKVTPPTSFSVSKDMAGSDRKTLWFNSRFYRINLLWENGGLRIRDIHLFNEQMPSVYETQPVTANECTFFTLPVVDGYLWSNRDDAGLRLKAMINGQEILLQGGTPQFSTAGTGTMKVNWPLTSIEGTLEIALTEKQAHIKLIAGKPLAWYFDLTTAAGKPLPFTTVSPKSVACHFENMDYAVNASKGYFSKPDNNAAFRLSPDRGEIVIDFDRQ